MRRHSIAQPFLYMIPTTLASALLLSSTYNRPCVREGVRRSSVEKITRFACKKSAAFSLATLLGRHYLTFGTSRSGNLTFPDEGDVDLHHFIIHLDSDSGAITLTDVSADGLEFTAAGTSTARRLHADTIPVQSHMMIRLGREGRYGFILLVDSSTCQQGETLLPRMLQYRRSIDRALSFASVAVDDRSSPTVETVEPADVAQAQPVAASPSSVTTQDP